MRVSAPPRDWFSTTVGLTAAISLAAGLAWMVFGPSATRPAGSPWQLVWVNIVRPQHPPPPPPPLMHPPRVREDIGVSPPPEIFVPAPGHS